VRNPIKDKIAKHANIVEAGRYSAISDLADIINEVQFARTWPDIEGFTLRFGGNLYKWFEKKILPDIVAESARFYKDLTGKKAPVAIYPNWRLEFLERKLKQAGDNFVLDIEIQAEKYRRAGVGTRGISNAFERDFKMSNVEMKEKGKDGDKKFTVGYGRWYSGYWSGLYKIISGYYTEANTSFTTTLLTAGE